MASESRDTFEIFTSIRYDPVLSRVDSLPDHAGWNRCPSVPTSGLYMLDEHCGRLLRAATNFGWDKVARMLSGDEGMAMLDARVTENIPSDEKSSDSPLQLKIAISQVGVVRVEKKPTPSVSLAVLFPEMIPPPGIDTDAVTEAKGGESKSAGHVGVVPGREPKWDVLVDPGRTRPGEFTHFKTSRREMYTAARARAHIEPGDTKEVLIISDGDEAAVVEGSITTPYFWRGGRWVTPPVRSGDRLGGQDGTTRRWALARGLAAEEPVAAASLADGEECWLSNGVKGFFCGVARL